MSFSCKCYSFILICFFVIIQFTDVVESAVKAHEFRDPELSTLAKELPGILLHSKSKNTARQYNRAFRKWGEWANRHNVNSLSESSIHLALYLVSIIQSSNSPSCIDEAFYGIRWAYELAGHSNNPCDCPMVKSVREAAHRILGHSVTKKEPVTPEIMNRLMNMFGHESAQLQDVRNLSMCFVAYAGFLRFSELSNIKRSDLSFNTDFVSVHIRSSKTDLYREGDRCIIARTGSRTCPVNLLERYLKFADIPQESDEFIFRPVSFCKSKKCYKLKGVKCLSYTRSREVVLNMFTLIGLDKTKFGLHSLRSGGATAAANFGISDRLFKRHGRWRTDKAKGGYVKDDISKLLSVTQNIGI